MRGVIRVRMRGARKPKFVLKNASEVMRCSGGLRQIHPSARAAIDRNVVLLKKQ